MGQAAPQSSANHSFSMKEVGLMATTPLTPSLSQSLVEEYLAKGGEIHVGPTKRCTGAEKLSRR